MREHWEMSPHMGVQKQYNVSLKKKKNKHARNNNPNKIKRALTNSSDPTKNN